MPGYRLSPAAQGDLDGIWQYTLRHWGVVQAERYLLAIRDACDALTLGTRQGRPIEEIRAGYRKLVVGAHLIFYRTDPDGRIAIIRILHQRMDVRSRLDEE